MPRPRPQHLHRETTRHGVTVWYVRIGKGPRIRIKAKHGTSEFEEEYQAAIAGKKLSAKRGHGINSLAWLYERYRDSSAWSTLSLATRRQRENIMKHVLASAGAEPYAEIDRKTIIAGRERRKDTPAQANNFIKAMRGLFKWAVDAEHVNADPTADVDWLSVKTEGFHTWTDAEVDKFERRWPVGTRERLAMHLLLYTGLRRGDVVRLGPQHVTDGIFTIRTEKTDEEIVAPILPPLAATIAASDTGEMAFIVGESGRPMAKESFGNWFREACNAAGVPGSAHGLRKTGATRAANNGASEKHLEAIYGWRGGKMASHYTKGADRRRLAREAMEKLLSEQDRNVYSRTSQSGAGIKSKRSAKSKA